ncbi:hypothetical protein [Roseibium aggregatum]|uniref:Uncharacterized protein n=1 Tax=Roseibium aggregatum TaxID=187304 RepID=A0A0M6Y6Q8_9HYPH|nr:hypothetical protein [Roseibium aggregatum]CTQ45782.1 hypothetical protein LAL4801_04237 [Roseibium aggregatum]
MLGGKVIEVLVRALPYVLAGILAIFVLFKIEENGRLKADLKTAKAELAATYEAAAKKDLIIEADRKRALEDFHTIREMEREIDGLETYLEKDPSRNRECLDSADVERLRLIFGDD